MSRFAKRSTVAAPLEDVWAFHSTVEGLVAVTPSWLSLRVESVTGPDGEPDPGVLEAGATVELSMRPFGVGPRQAWRSRIAERVRWDGLAWFRDVMEGGPFPRWEHTHRFRARGEHTVIEDHVDYRLPLLPGPLSALGWPGFALMFAHRHRRTRALLEDG